MAKFKYGDMVRVNSGAHPDFGKTGRVVEAIPDATPWVTLDTPSDDAYGGETLTVALEDSV